VPLLHGLLASPAQIPISISDITTSLSNQSTVKISVSLSPLGMLIKELSDATTTLSKYGFTESQLILGATLMD